MIPVDQTTFGKGHGNCLAACVASITELPLDSLVLEWDDREDGEHWYDTLSKALPCPFCGKDAVTTLFKFMPSDSRWLAHCPDEGCVGHDTESVESTGLGWFVDGWNRRAALPAPAVRPPSREAVVEALNEMENAVVEWAQNSEALSARTLNARAALLALYAPAVPVATEPVACRYCNGAGWTQEDGGEGEAIQVGCEYCCGTGDAPAQFPSPPAGEPTPAAGPEGGEG